ncbi:MAG: hypothetical protein WCJ29_01880 [bacterium]
MVNEKGDVTISLRDLTRTQLFTHFADAFRSCLTKRLPKAVNGWTDADWKELAESYFGSFSLPKQPIPLVCIEQKHTEKCASYQYWLQSVDIHVDQTLPRARTDRNAVILPNHDVIHNLGAARFHEIMMALDSVPTCDEAREVFGRSVNYPQDAQDLPRLAELNEADWQEMIDLFVASAQLWKFVPTKTPEDLKVPREAVFGKRDSLMTIYNNMAKVSMCSGLKVHDSTKRLSQLNSETLEALAKTTEEVHECGVFIRDCLTICGVEEIKTLGARGEILNTSRICNQFSSLIPAHEVVTAVLKIGSGLALDAAKHSRGRASFKKLVDLLAKLPEDERRGKLQETADAERNAAEKKPLSSSTPPSSKPMTRAERLAMYKETRHAADFTEIEAPNSKEPSVEIQSKPEEFKPAFEYGALQVKDVIRERGVALHAQIILSYISGMKAPIANEKLVLQIEQNFGSQFSRRQYGEAVRWLTRQRMLAESKGMISFIAKNGHPLSKEAVTLHERIRELQLVNTSV